jgi:L-methionine (R)-S-oxide reductase
MTSPADLAHGAFQKQSTQTVEQEFLQAIVAHFGSDTGTLHVINSQDGLLHLRATAGEIPKPVQDLIRTIPLGKGIAGQAAERREPISICNIKSHATSVVRPGAKSMGIEGALCIPMIANGVVVGTLGIGFREARTFTEAEQRFLLEAGQAFAEGLLKQIRAG